MNEIEFKKGSGNAYADPGFTDAADMQAKAGLATRMRELVDLSKASMPEAAQIAGVDETELANIFRGQFQQYTLAQIEEMHNRILCHWPPCEADDDPLSEADHAWLHKEAEKNTPKGKRICVNSLLPANDMADLQMPEDITAYVEACLATKDEALIQAALQDPARAREKWNLPAYIGYEELLAGIPPAEREEVLRAVDETVAQIAAKKTARKADQDAPIPQFLLKDGEDGQK